MAGTGGRAHPPLSRRLLDETGRFDFFQAVRLLERIAARQGLIGEDTPPSGEAVRFHAVTSTGFPASEVAAIRPPEAEEDGAGPSPHRMAVTFMGLTGPKGALPSYFNRIVHQRNRSKDSTLRDFLDLFNHRAISLFYRAWAKYRFPIEVERARGQGGPEDAFTQCLYGLVGLGTGGQRPRLADDRAFLYYAGLFAHQPRPAISLERMLSDHFDMTARVREFSGQWLTLDVADRSRLPGRDDPDEGMHNQLGRDAILGERVWDVASKFRVRLEDLTLDQFWRLLPRPVGDLLEPLGQLTRAYAGADLDFDVQLVLRRYEWPRVEIGGEDQLMPLLGWNTWLRTFTLDAESDDAIFAGESETS